MTLLTHASNCAAQLGVYFGFMRQLPSVDLAFLMNVIGTLTALPEANFEGFNGESAEDVAELLTALLGVLRNEENEQLDAMSSQKEAAGFVESLFGQQVSTCHKKRRPHQKLTETDQVRQMRAGHDQPCAILLSS